MAATERDWERRLGRRIKLRDLHILSTVVQRGSMARAASHLAMSQPAVSEAIANLEAALRVRLLDRSVRGVEPTIYASALIRRERAVFDELQQGIKEIEFLSDPTAGEVRIAAPEVLLSGLLPDVIDRLSRRHPRILVEAVPADISTLEFPELRGREVDFLLARVPESGVGDDVNLETFLDDPHFVVAGARSRWARRRNITLPDLVDAPWVFPRGQVIRQIIGEAFRAHGLAMPRERVTAGTLHMHNHLLATGRFVTITANSVLHYNARQWSLKALPIDLRVKSQPHAIVTLKNRTLSPVAQRFIDELKAVAGATLMKWPQQAAAR